MPAVSLALLWHQHQPYYPDDVSGETLMPWVRLHGTKDYYGMALHLLEVPEFRCTINLVPSLLLQLEAYTKHGRSDRHLDVSRMPADGLGETDACYLLDNFFMANADNMIRPYPRYNELYLRRGLGIDPVEAALPRFSEKDLRDLQVWNNLTWIHPLAFEQDADLREFLRKGRNWTESEKQWFLVRQMEILGQVIPLHRKLAESGQIELTTTPFYHPILPLLWDKRCARQAMPGCPLPKNLEPYQEDARRHVQRAVEYHAKLFGSPPRGMWPSEGSVSQEIVPIIAEAGIEWIATDEEILAASTNGWVSRDGQGHMRHPEMLFRPWRVEEAGKSLQIVFRDHAMSDLVGFHYQRMDADHAVDDLLGKVDGIARAVAPANAGRPALVPIILDGENCWEYYPDGGVKFLRQLYRRCAANPHVRPVRIGDFVRENPATDRIGHLFAGSWISHNFAIWIGHHEDVKAWELLHETRDFLKRTAAEGRIPPETLARAWEEIDIAEGSDWYWWFGEDHSSALDALFDQLFRKHLQNVYALLGVPAPVHLSQPIAQEHRRSIHSQPKGFLRVKVDGRRTYFEWINAGTYVAGSERGTMTMVTEGLVREIHFGFDAERLMIRLDTQRSAAEDLARLDELRIRCVEPAGLDLVLAGFAQRRPKIALHGPQGPVAAQGLHVAVDQIVELSVPFAALGLKEDDPLRFFVEAFESRSSCDRAPGEGTIDLKIPSPDFELVMWQA